MKQKTRILIYILIAAAVVIIGAIAILSGGKTGDSVQNHLDLGRKYLEELSYDEAEMEFKEAIRIDPADPEPYIELADLYTNTDRAEMAVDILETGYRETEDENILQVLRELEAKPNNDNDSSDENFPAGSETGDGGDQSGNNSAAGGGNTGSGSANEELAEVPNLIGLSEEEAVSLCEEKGFLHSVSRQNSNDVKKGVVMEQTIPAGTMAAKGIGIPFAVSEGKVMVELPELSGLSEDEARKVCNDIGIGVNVSYESSNDVNEGFVINQNIPAGAKVAEEASVRISISEGKKLEYNVKLLEKVANVEDSKYVAQYPYIKQHGYREGEAASDRVTRYFDGQYRGEVYYSIETGTQSLNLSPRYSTVNQFSEGLAFFIRDRQKFEDGKVTSVQGYINEKGQEVFSYTYTKYPDDSFVYSSGSAYIENVLYVNNYPDYKNNLNMINGYAAYHPNNDYYGFIDKQGNVVVDAKYNTVYSFTEGLAAVSKESTYDGGKFGFIDTEGNLVIGYEYDYISRGFENGAAIVCIKDNVVSWEYKYGVINKNGETIIPIIYNNIIPAGEKFYIIGVEDGNQNKYGVFDVSGNVIVDCLYDFISISDNNMIIVGNWVSDAEQLYGLFNSKGQMVLDVKYTSLYSGKPITSMTDYFDMIHIVYGSAEDLIIAQDEKGISLYDMQYRLITEEKNEFYLMDWWDGYVYINLFDPTGYIKLKSGKYMDKYGNVYNSHPYEINDILEKINGTEDLYITTREFDGPFNIYRITHNAENQ